MQIFLAFPPLEPLYFHYEKNFDPYPLQTAMVRLNYSLPIAAVVLYLLFCWYGVKAMKRNEPFKLTGTLAAWNFLLSMFSFYGASRTVPHLFYRILTHPIEDTVCETAYLAYGHGVCGFATYLFILSKIPELFDTVFIVLRKKPLIFLHWYHHVTVLLYCWNAYVTQSSAGLWFIAMNYSVHAVMYLYYALQILRVLPSWFPSWIITTMQILQMVVGTVIVCASLFYYFFGSGGGRYAPGECHNEVSNLVVGGLIYASYLYLFVDFAVKRYGCGSCAARISASNSKSSSVGRSSNSSGSGGGTAGSSTGSTFGPGGTGSSIGNSSSLKARGVGNKQPHQQQQQPYDRAFNV